MVATSNRTTGAAFNRAARKSTTCNGLIAAAGATATAAVAALASATCSAAKGTRALPTFTPVIALSSAERSNNRFMRAGDVGRMYANVHPIYTVLQGAGYGIGSQCPSKRPSTTLQSYLARCFARHD